MTKANMMNNPSMIDEIRDYREQHVRKFGFDLERIVEDTQRTEEKLREEGWDVVTLKAAKCQSAEIAVCRESKGKSE